MTLDGITLGAVVRELRLLEGAKIEKIHQPRRDDILLHLHTSSGRKKLLLSSQGSESRIHLTCESPENPPAAPNFCMLLRKYISGGKILGITMSGLERIVRIAIEARDEMAVTVRYFLVIEIMGKYSNIMLLDPGERILDCLHRVSLDMSRVRQVLPGMPYQEPELSKIYPAEENRGRIAEALLGGPLPDVIADSLEGFTRTSAQEVLARAFGENVPSFLNPEESSLLTDTLLRFVADCLASKDPCLQKNGDGKPVFFAPIAYMTFPEQNRIHFDSANEMVDAYYIQKTTSSKLTAQKNALLKVLKRRIGRVEKKLQFQLDTLLAANDCDRYRLYGELLTSNIYAVTRGMSEVTVVNYYDGQPITIPLDVKLSPSANATKYFKKVGKLKNGAAVASKKSQEYKDELRYLEELEFNTQEASSTEDLAEVRSELIRLGYLDAAPKEKLKRGDPLEKPYRFRSTDGMQILAGRNSRQNDALTMHVASPTDIWLHSKSFPGSHVILFTKGQPVSDLSLFEAATIAATLCKAKTSPKVDIDYAPRSRVWKANGARPGMVLYENYETITVSPDTNLLAKLQITENE